MLQDEFPSFYFSKSGYPSPLRLDSADEIARLLHTKWLMGLQGPVLVANPVPQSQETGREQMELHIGQALAAAEHQQIKGKEVTPFLLKYIAQHSNGESLETNIALILNNAKAGAAIAVTYASLVNINS